MGPDVRWCIFFRSRQNSRKQAAELLRAGRINEARNFLRRCIDITHEMALALIHECRRRNVDCIVAPYEADAQLAYLNLKNIAQIVITEDSDLVLFGCTKVYRQASHIHSFLSLLKIQFLTRQEITYNLHARAQDRTQCRIFCLPVCYPKIQRLIYTEL